MKKMLSNEDRLYLVQSYRRKALESLEDAKDFLERRPGLSMRMSYEAVYHFTAALFCDAMNKLIENNITKLEQNLTNQ